jgi:hypothetical protein
VCDACAISGKGVHSKNNISTKSRDAPLDVQGKKRKHSIICFVSCFLLRNSIFCQFDSVRYASASLSHIVRRPTESARVGERERERVKRDVTETRLEKACWVGGWMVGGWVE